MGLIGNTKEEQFYNFFLERIPNLYGLFGLAGNIRAESNFISTNLQNSYEKKLGMTDDTYTTSVDNGDYTNFIKDKAGYGIAQWTYWSRKQSLYEYARKLSRSIGDYEMQLNHLYNELNQHGLIDKLNDAKSIREASDIILTKYEQPADQSEKIQILRTKYGQELYDELVAEKKDINMNNSSLVCYTGLSPNHSGTRTHSIDRITPHCVVGQLDCEAICACFPAGRNASCNYGIGKDGRISLCVEEKNRSWCTSSKANDQRAVTIECASDKIEPYTMTDAVYKSLVKLCVDICRRNGKNKLIWFGDKDKSLNHNPANNEMIITVHRWFANKSCPGDWLYSRLDNLAKEVTAELGGYLQSNDKHTDGTTYRVQCGAFSVKANADNMLADIKSKGFDAFITQVDGMYKVQIGAYSVKSNAEAQLQKVKNAGFDAFITTKAGQQVSTFAPTKKSNAEIAKEIYSGTCSDPRWSSWGGGNTRVERLHTAGYDTSAVQKEVNKLF